jgi:hypothetical protein
MNDVTGYFPSGIQAFTSRNLRGLIDYGRKHGITKVTLGDCTSGDGLYRAEFSNGVVCNGSFASPSVMLGFFLGRGFVSVIDCERHVFNQGVSMGRITLPFMCSIDRDGTPLRFGPWIATAYRDEHQTPMVKFMRD